MADLISELRDASGDVCRAARGRLDDPPVVGSVRQCAHRAESQVDARGVRAAWGRVAEGCYHALNVVPFSLRKEGFERAFIVVGVTSAVSGAGECI